MVDNSAQYTEREWERQDAMRNAQKGRTQSERTQGSRGKSSEARRIPGTQERRVQSSGATHARSGRVMSEREQILRQQKTMKRQIRILFCFMCVMLILNVVAAVSMHFRMQHMEEALKTMGSRMSTGRTDMGGTMASSDAQTGSVPSMSGGQASPDSGNSVTGQDYVNLCGLEYVDRPRERTMEQVFDCLDQLAKEDERIAEILENHYKYPDKLLEALANNPEMTDFVMGYEENAGKVSGGLTRDEMEQDFPLFLQWDPRWGYGEYGDNSSIALAGCGPTCLSMALFYLTGNENLTPDKMAEYSMKNGYYISGTGTAWALLQDVPEKYGVSVSQPQAEEYTMKTALDSGSVIICSMGPGDFTAAGHFIVIYGYDRTGFLVNDPNCVARSRQTWSFSELKGQIKNIWVMGGSVKYEGVTYKSVTDVKD